MQSVQFITESTAGTPILYVEMTFASTVTLPSLPAFSFTLPSIAPSSAYEIGFDDPTKGSTYALGAEGPGIVTGSVVSFLAPAAPVTFVGGTNYFFSLYSAKLSPIVATPATLSFSAFGASAAQTVAISEAGYSGTFTATSSNTNVATVSGTSSSFTVTPVAGGTATVTFTDSFGQTTVVNVAVTAATLVPQ